MLKILSKIYVLIHKPQPRVYEFSQIKRQKMFCKTCLEINLQIIRLNGRREELKTLEPSSLGLISYHTYVTKGQRDFAKFDIICKGLPPILIPTLCLKNP